MNVCNCDQCALLCKRSLGQLFQQSHDARVAAVVSSTCSALLRLARPGGVQLSHARPQKPAPCKAAQAAATASDVADSQATASAATEDEHDSSQESLVRQQDVQSIQVPTAQSENRSCDVPERAVDVTAEVQHDGAAGGGEGRSSRQQYRNTRRWRRKRKSGVPPPDAQPAPYILLPQPGDVAIYGAEDMLLGPELHNRSRYWQAVHATLAACGRSVSVTISASPAPPPTDNEAVAARVQYGKIKAELATDRPEADARRAVCVAVRALMHTWQPVRARSCSPQWSHAAMWARDSAMRRALGFAAANGNTSISGAACIVDVSHWYQAQVQELARHVIGSGRGDGRGGYGACGLPFLHSCEWIGGARDGSGRVQAGSRFRLLLTDGCGVWMTVVLQPLRLVACNRRKPAKQARGEQARRSRRHMLRQGALAAARQAREQFEEANSGGGRGAVVAMFAAMCCSLPEGLEVVAVQGGAVKEMEEQVAIALIPGLQLGMGSSAIEITQSPATVRMPWSSSWVGRGMTGSPAVPTWQRSGLASARSVPWLTVACGVAACGCVLLYAWRSRHGSSVTRHD
jgi:hypothetical protein